MQKLFVPQPGDEKVLWDAVCILDEKRDHYLVQWEGVDRTGQEWKPSWVLRWDCTDLLVHHWHLAKKEKARIRRFPRAAKMRTTEGSHEESSNSTACTGQAITSAVRLPAKTIPPPSTAHSQKSKIPRKRRRVISESPEGEGENGFTIDMHKRRRLEI